MESLLHKIFSELHKGVNTPKHPYRYFCLSSISENKPQQRMVVFRSIQENTISIYTDIRTPKASQLLANPNASILLYDYKKMNQIQLSGTVSIEKTYDNTVWESISPKAKKDYTTLLPPGSLVEAPDKVTYGNTIHFCILKFTFTKIDFLDINRPHHTRAIFNLTDNQWTGDYVIP